MRVYARPDVAAHRYDGMGIVEDDLADFEPEPAPERAPARAEAPARLALPARFQSLYQSRDGRLCLFEDEHGHLTAVDASKLA